jgi:hypothetical protein
LLFEFAYTAKAVKEYIMTLDFIRFEVLAVFWGCDLEEELKKLAKKDAEAGKKLRGLLQDHSEYLDRGKALSNVMEEFRSNVSFVDGDANAREAYRIIQSFHPEYFENVSFTCIFYSEDSDNNYDGLFGKADYDNDDDEDGENLPENIEDAFGFEYMEDNHGNNYIEYCAEWLIGWVTGEQIFHDEVVKYENHTEETKEWFKKKYEEEEELFNDDVKDEDYVEAYEWYTGAKDDSKGWTLFLNAFPQAKKDMFLYVWLLEGD